MTSIKLALLDRDGTINVKAPEDAYVLSVADLTLLPGAAEAIAQLTAADIAVRVVTNQRCISRGLLTDAELDAIHAALTERVETAGGRIDGFHVCPHGYDDGCNCRKPAPGLLLDATKAAGVNVGETVMIGDANSDIEAGRRARIRTIQILGDGPTAASHSVPTLLAAVQHLLA